MFNFGGGSNSPNRNGQNGSRQHSFFFGGGFPFPFGPGANQPGGAFHFEHHEQENQPGAGPQQGGGSAGSSGSRPTGAPRPDDYIPPASNSTIAGLPEIVISKNDLAIDDGANLECTICMEEQKLSGVGVKLPCGHIFCRDCITDWLHKQVDIWEEEQRIAGEKHRFVEHRCFSVRRFGSLSVHPLALVPLLTASGMSASTTPDEPTNFV